MVRHSQILGKTLAALALLLNACASSSQAQEARNTSTQDEKRLERFEKQVEDLRSRLKIPGMSAVIVKDQKVLWAEGLGFASRKEDSRDAQYAFPSRIRYEDIRRNSDHAARGAGEAESR